MSVGVMKDYKLKQMNLRASHTPTWLVRATDKSELQRIDTAKTYLLRFHVHNLGREVAETRKVL